LCSKILDWIAAVQLGFMTPKCLTCCDDYAVYILLFYVQNIKSVFLLVERYFEVFIDICVICNVNHLGTVCIWLWQHFFFFLKGDCGNKLIRIGIAVLWGSTTNLPIAQTLSFLLIWQHLFLPTISRRSPTNYL
jgi:hypothetical protein